METNNTASRFATGMPTAWPPGAVPRTQGNPAASSQATQQAQRHEVSRPGLRLDTRAISPMRANPMLTPTALHQPNAIPTPEHSQQLDPEAQAAPDSDSESRSVLPDTGASQRHPPATPLPGATPTAGCRRVAIKALIGSLPLIAAIALMVDGSKEDDDAELAAGAALLAGTLAGMAIDSLVDRVMAWCGSGATAS